MGQTLIIGDIHGCFDELQDLLDRAGLGAEDEIVALGDLVDRGPQNEAVVAFFRTRPHTRSIRGNHEHKHVLQHQGRLRVDLSQQITRRAMGRAAHAAFCVWAETLPPLIQRPEALLVHGFVEPGVPLDEQKLPVLLGLTTGERHLQERLSAPWYTLIEHPTPIVVGHRDYRRDGEPLVYRDRVFGVDTTVYAGGRLTGLLLPSFRLVSVPARQDHWTETRVQHADLRYEQTPLEALSWEKARAVLAAYRRYPPTEALHRQRQGRLAALLHAAEGCIRTILAEVETAIKMDQEEQIQWISASPYGWLLTRRIHGGQVDAGVVERYLRRPAAVLLPQEPADPEKSH